METTLPLCPSCQAALELHDVTVVEAGRRHGALALMCPRCEYVYELPRKVYVGAVGNGYAHDFSKN